MFDFENYADLPGAPRTAEGLVYVVKLAERLWDSYLSAVRPLPRPQHVSCWDVSAAHCHCAGSPGAGKWPEWKLPA